MVLQTLVADEDLRESRERNRLSKLKGNTLAEKYENAKAVTAMYHFNNFGCAVGMNALQKKREIDQLNNAKVYESHQKQRHDFEAKKKKYDEVIAMNIDDEKLNVTQSKILLMMKKRKTDKAFSSLKKNELLNLWKEWKGRVIEEPTFSNAVTNSATNVPMRNTEDNNDTSVLVINTDDVMIDNPSDNDNSVPIFDTEDFIVDEDINNDNSVPIINTDDAIVDNATGTVIATKDDVLVNNVTNNAKNFNDTGSDSDLG